MVSPSRSVHQELLQKLKNLQPKLWEQSMLTSSQYLPLSPASVVSLHLDFRLLSIMKRYLICISFHRNVRVDTMLNKQIWSQGIRNVPKRIRVRLERRRDEDEEATEKVSS